PVQLLAMPVVVEADGELVGLLVPLKGLVIQANRAGTGGNARKFAGGNGRERAIAVDVAALAADPGPATGEFQLFRDDEVAALQHRAVVNHGMMSWEEGNCVHSVEGVGVQDRQVEAVAGIQTGGRLAAAEVVEVADPAVGEEAEAAPLAG